MYGRIFKKKKSTDEVNEFFVSNRYVVVFFTFKLCLKSLSLTELALYAVTEFLGGSVFFSKISLS